MPFLTAFFSRLFSRAARRASFSVLAVLAVFWGVPSADAVPPLIPFGSTWSYFDLGYDLGTEWREYYYDDEDWSSGPAQLGYGDGDEATVVYYGSDDENKFVTTYFRHGFSVGDPGSYPALNLRLLRDDGAVVYLNGTEIFRSNMPDGYIDYETYAASRLNYPAETNLVSIGVNPALLVAGYNVIAVEVHQFEPASPDLSFDLELAPSSVIQAVTRGPYLQLGTSTNMTVRWRTTVPGNSRVEYGLDASDLSLAEENAAFTTEHSVTLRNLDPGTTYYYSIGSTAATLAGDGSYFFTTAPLPGTPQPTRIWAIGDFGTGYLAQRNVRDAYANFTGTRPTDVWLMLGDNAYNTGLDSEYQAAVFNIYPQMFRQTVAWSTLGNHDTAGSTLFTDAYPYFSIFTMPKNGEAGGVPSGTAHYYSFDYANIHFVCLDSQTASRAPAGAMFNWLRADLAATSQDWIIAYWHHPPYSRGSHTSDFETSLVEMRERAVPILESYGVDLVLGGHSHSYERSFLINGHYGLSTSLTAAMKLNPGSGRTNTTGAYLKAAGGLGANQGAVYSVVGTAGGQGGGGSLNHPAMYYSTLNYGSLVIDVSSNRLDAKFLRDTGAVDDYFTIIKGDHPAAPRPALQIARSGGGAVLRWPTSQPGYALEGAGLMNLAPAWGTIPNPPALSGRQNVVDLPSLGTNVFFRLRKLP